MVVERVTEMTSSYLGNKRVRSSFPCTQPSILLQFGYMIFCTMSYQVAITFVRPVFENVQKKTLCKCSTVFVCLNFSVAMTVLQSILLCITDIFSLPVIFCGRCLEATASLLFKSVLPSMYVH